MNIVGTTDQNFLSQLIKKRPRNLHKGDCGKVLAICGSEGMAGAAVFTSKAAMRCGSGLVKLVTPEVNFPVIQISVPEVICTKWDDVKDNLAQFDSVAIGPGMGKGERTRKLLEEVLEKYDGTIIIDADGLNTMAGNPDLWVLVQERTAKGKAVVMTPHTVEAGRLLAAELLNRGPTEFSKKELAEMLVDKFGCVAVIKGENTLVAVSREEAFVNTTGNPGMATGGSGDVLTGIIASLAGQGLKAGDAARAGVFLHGMSGDLAAESLGEYGLIAGDIVDNLPLALKKIVG